MINCSEMIPFLIRILNTSENNLRLTKLVNVLLGCLANKCEQADQDLCKWIHCVEALLKIQEPNILMLQIQASAHVSLVTSILYY
jgi:hypothetical protein